MSSKYAAELAALWLAGAVAAKDRGMMACVQGMHDNNVKNLTSEWYRWTIISKHAYLK